MKRRLSLHRIISYLSTCFFLLLYYFDNNLTQKIFLVSSITIAFLIFVEKKIYVPLKIVFSNHEILTRIFTYVIIIAFFISYYYLENFQRLIIVAATPFIYEPETFSQTYVKISTFILCDKVVIRANVSDSEGNQEATWMNLTDASNNLIYTNELMTNTTQSCGTNCWIFEINYTLKSTDPTGTWMINVTANDTNGNLGSNSTTFTVEAAPAGCNCLIRFLPYTITESNKVYCMNESLYYNGTAIEFSEGVQNTTLDCRGNSLDSDGAGYGVYLTGSATKNNTIKNCNVTDFKYAIYLHYSSNSTLTNITANSNSYGIYLYSSNNNKLKNITVKNSLIRGLFISGSDNNLLQNITSINNSYYGISLSFSDNNILQNIISRESDEGIYLTSSHNNTISEARAENNSVYGIHLDSSGSTPNNITNGSVANNGIDYYLSGLAGKVNYFKNTNFTASRKIKFADNTSWFYYNNRTDIELWLKTNVSSAPLSITRKIISWTQSLVEWNDSAGVATTARYNLTGLNPSKTYEVYNNSQLVYAFDTDSSGNLPSFTITLPQNSERNIKVQEVTGHLEVELILPVPSSITKVDQNAAFPVNATVYCRGGNCGNVSGTIRYNLTSSNPDTPVNETSGDKPFYLQDPSATKACPTNPLSENEFCNLTWSVVASGDFVSFWKIGVLFNSSYSSVQDNHTDNATIEIVECHESMNVGWDSIDFGNLNPNTPGADNPAPGNSNLLYNLTNKGTCNETLWIKGTDIKNSTLPPPNTIGVGNLTWSNTTNDYSNSHPMTYDYSLLYSNLTPDSILTTYYWLAVPPVYAGKYEGNLIIGWNTTQQTG